MFEINYYMKDIVAVKKGLEVVSLQKNTGHL